MPKVPSTSIRSLVVAVLVAVTITPALPSASLGADPAPGATIRYEPDLIAVRFRQAPSETDLEIFMGRQFLMLEYYVGLSHPPGLGWYVFHIEDGMDALIVRELLRKDPTVCKVALATLGERVAVGSPEPDPEDPRLCDDVPAATQPPAAERQPAAGSGAGEARPTLAAQLVPASTTNSDRDALVPLLILMLLLVGGLCLHRLRRSTRP